MLKSTGLKIQMSETREKVNDLCNATSPADVSQRDTLEAELKAMEGEYREALTAESKEINKAFDTPESSEYREAMEITRKADLGTLVANAIARRNQTGAEAEAQVAWGLDGNQIPMAMISEFRTVAAPSDGGGTQPVSGYVFPLSIQNFANIARPMVPAGAPVYPSVVTAAVAGRPAEGAAHGSTEPTLRGQLLSPARIQAVASVTVEDRARYPALGPALASHLAEAVAAGMDTQALSDNNGFFDATSGPLTAPNDPGAASTYDQWAAILAKVVDGRHAGSMAEGGLLLHPDAFADAEKLYRGNNSDMSFAERIARVSRMRVSDAMPDSASSISGVLIVRGGAPASIQPTGRASPSRTCTPIPAPAPSP